MAVMMNTASGHRDKYECNPVSAFRLRMNDRSIFTGTDELNMDDDDATNEAILDVAVDNEGGTIVLLKLASPSRSSRLLFVLLECSSLRNDSLSSSCVTNNDDANSLIALGRGMIVTRIP